MPPLYKQRLKTLQVLVDAAQAAVAMAGDKEKGDLQTLLVANTHKVKIEDDRLRLLPTNVDRTALKVVMEAQPPVEHSKQVTSKARVVEAHRHFCL